LVGEATIESLKKVKHHQIGELLLKGLVL